MNIDGVSGLGQALFDEAGDALFLFDPETDQLLNVNPMAEKLTGFRRQELLSQLATWCFRFTAPPAAATLRQAGTQTGVFHSEEGYQLRTRNADVWLPVNLTVTRLHVRPKTLALITARDIRAVREAHRQVQQKEAELRRVLTSVSDCLWSAPRSTAKGSGPIATSRRWSRTSWASRPSISCAACTTGGPSSTPTTGRAGNA